MVQKQHELGKGMGREMHDARISRAGKVALFLLLITFSLQKKHKIFKPFADWMSSGFSFPPTFQKNLYFYLSDIALIATACLFFRIGIKACQNLCQGSSKYLALFFIAAWISLLFSAQNTCPLHYIRLTHFLLFLFFFCTMESGRVFKEIEGIFPKICICMLVLSLFECTVASLQYYYQSDLGLRFLGEGKALKAFNSSKSALWLFGSRSDASSIMRSMGTFLHANVFGGFIATAIPMTYFLFWQSRTTLQKAGCAAAIFFQIFALFLSFSRAALLAWVIMSGFWLFFCLRVTKTEKRGARPLLLIALTGAILCVWLLFPVLKDRGGVVNYNALVKESDQGRILYQDIALEMIKEHPLVGVGYNQYVLCMQEFCLQPLKPSQMYPVHNIYLLAAAETGLIGALGLLLFIGSILKRALTKSMTLAQATLLSIFIGLLWIGCCDYYLWSSQAGKLLFFSIAALLSRSALAKIECFHDSDVKI